MEAPVVIVGAAMGGLRAAEALRKSGYTGELVVVGGEKHAPYNRPPLSKEVLSSGVSHEAVAFPQRPATADVKWMLGSPATSADLDARTVTMEDDAQQEWSALVIATGLRSRRLPLQELNGVHAVRTLDDAMALREELVEGARLVVLGSGFVGCEIAATARKLGCEVTIVSPTAMPIIRPLGSDLSSELRKRHDAHGVEFVAARTVVDVEGDAKLEAVMLDTGQRIEADVLVEAIGSECNVEWLDDSGLDLSDGVLTDAAMRGVLADGTVRDDVYVVGDVARFPNLMFDDVPRRIEHWNIPTDTGKRAGSVLAAWLAGDGSFEQVVALPFTPMPSFWSNQFEVALQAYGLPGLADEGGIRLLEGDLSGEAIMGYYRGELLVGVVGLGMKAALLPYRQQIGGGG